ncbi:unnamed protein product [Rhizoctonia solani]|uniref:SAP domain-containing protein n=1 Tax=Rhizoctonia solani TaxID=456999 RepID=A0A8H3CYP4_9AGAM|nr:unnamed protein product [Rhizoctonia solani]
MASERAFHVPEEDIRELNAEQGNRNKITLGPQNLLSLATQNDVDKSRDANFEDRRNAIVFLLSPPSTRLKPPSARQPRPRLVDSLKMSIPTRAELEALKRTALQGKCKELGIKANSKSEMLIELVLEHYQSTAGPSKPSTSSKRKAQDDAKSRRVRPKVEPEETLLLHTSPRRAKVMEVLIRSPPKARGRGKGKAKAQTPVDDETDVLKMAHGAYVPQVGHATTAQPLGPTSTSMTILDTATEMPALDDTRIADLELQIRNARKAGDESARDVLALKAFQNAIQQAFGDSTSSDTLDTMGQLAKLRDIAPKLVAAAQLDPDMLYSRLDTAEQQITVFEAAHQKNQTEISELQDRLRELETGMPDVGELEAAVRQLQSQFNRIPDTVFNNTRPEESAIDSRYTIIRPASAAPVAGPSNSQRPSSQLSAPQEDGLFPSQNQDQNSGRASSAAKSSRGSRPPLAEKEKEVEVDARRSPRPSSPLRSRTSSHSSRYEPYSRSRSSEPPTPSRGKGKGRLIKTPLDTVKEDETPIPDVADPFTPTVELPRSPPTAVARESATPSEPSSPSASVSKQAPTATSLPALPALPVLPAPLALDLPTLPTIGASGPIAQLPFKLIASSAKPSSETTARSSAPTGRVARTSTRPHAPSARFRPTSGSTETQPQSFFNFAPPPASTTSTTNGATKNSPSTTNGTTKSSSTTNRGHGFITPERLGANFSMFPPARVDFGRTPGGLAFKTTGRAPPGTPAVTNTLFGTEVARDTRFADMPYDPDASRGSVSWEEGLPVWPAGIPRNAASS